jgi:hypothetical protein
VVLFCLAPLLQAKTNSIQKPNLTSLHFEGINLENGSLKLTGADAHEQLLVTGKSGDNLERDLTSEASFETVPAGIVRIDSGGMLTPLKDGITTVTVSGPDSLKSSLNVRVENFAATKPINFPNQIVPIFTKNGCNGGGCHGKSGGQNGFRLSLLGFEPEEDYEYLVKEARGRRLFPAVPERSLLLAKATAMLPHGGGKRLSEDSADYKLMARWISQGMPYGSPKDPSVARIEVLPKERTLSLGGSQQLKVLAHYTDGTREDVTRSTLFEPNDKDLGKVDENGKVTVYERPGDVAVMVRYQSRVAVFRAAVPLGAPVENLPPAKNFVDELVFAKLKKMGLPPSDQCGDSVFIRRVTLDIAGRLPSAEETTKFLADADPAKRDKWIEYLLQTPEYAEFFANKWSALLRNKRANDTHTRGTYAFYSWIRDSLLENRPYNEFVRQIVAASGDISDNPPVAWFRQVRTATTQLEDTAQLFLGQRLQCAQCHHHPFEKWSQQDYFSFSAFFSQVGRKQGSQPGEEIIFHRRGMPSATNPKTKKAVQPAGLGATPPVLSVDKDPRLALSEWLASKDNPFFGKALVNRYWKHFFNRGLVDPEDDMRETNPPSNPELLEALARNFIESGYDLKNLVRTICHSRSYQLDSEPNKYNAPDKQNFSRYYPKRLPAEVLLDAINQVTATENSFDGLPRGIRAVQLPDNSFNANSYFLTVFGRPEMSSSCECERSGEASLAQSLHLLNSKDIQTKLTADKARAALLAMDSSRPDEQKLRELYILAFSREPRAEELQRGKEYIVRKIGTTEKEKIDRARRDAYEDIVWALVSTKEFLFNH